MKKIKTKLIVLLMCGTLMMVNSASASGNGGESALMHYTANAPTSANTIASSLGITPIRLTYKGRYGWQCYVQLDSLTSTVGGTYVSGTFINIGNYYNLSGALMIGTPLGTCEAATNSPSNVVVIVELGGDYSTGDIAAVLSSCNDFT